MKIEFNRLDNESFEGEEVMHCTFTPVLLLCRKSSAQKKKKQNEKKKPGEKRLNKKQNVLLK